MTKFPIIKHIAADNNSNFVQIFMINWPHLYWVLLVVTEKAKFGWKSGVLELVTKPVFVATCVNFLLVSVVRGACTDWGQLYLIQDMHHSHLTGISGVYMELAHRMWVNHCKEKTKTKKQRQKSMSHVSFVVALMSWPGQNLQSISYFTIIHKMKHCVSYLLQAHSLGTGQTFSHLASFECAFRLFPESFNHRIFSAISSCSQIHQTCPTVEVE